MMDQLIRLLQSSICFGTVIMYGAIGEILTEKSGNLNLGVPGIMYLGGISGLAASFFYEFNNPDPNGLVCLLISFLAAFLVSALGGLLYSFLTITLRANQNVTGLTLTIFGGGIANFFGGSLAMLPVAEDGSLRPARRVVREPKPRGWLHGMHSVGVLDGGALVGAVSLSQSEFVVYRADDGSRAAAYGFGERVFARSFDSFGAWIYVMLQDPGDIYVLRNRCAEGLGLECVQVISVLPEPRELYGTSAIRVSPDGKLLIAAVRRTNSLTLFRIGGDGRLTRSDVVELPGLTPRDLQISPDSRVVVTALQASDEICVHEIDREQGSLVLRDSGLHIPSPASVAIRKEARP